jgi:hypothetical protein
VLLIKLQLNIIKSETGRLRTNDGITRMNINGNLTDHLQTISDSLNNHFLSDADKIINKTPNKFNHNPSKYSPLEYLINVFKDPFPNIKYNISRQQIEELIKSLKPTNLLGYDKISVKISN